MKISLLLLFLSSIILVNGQDKQWSSSEIYANIQELNVLGKVLYLAAHPDDENTRFIAYCANEKRFQTAYLSLTRGDGGQNLIGPELREELGLIRTQELLAARRTDGGMQFFTRANDFGYSKNPEETFEIWNKAAVLGDVVYAIRAFQPDVIVCRFPTDGGGGHGHHTASALLGEEAFNLAADPKAYPEQLEKLKTWQAKRIVVNTGRWWNPNISTDDKGVVAEDVGAFLPLMGISCNEIAAHSRTQHKSQGFGSTGSRGEQLEYFEHLQGLEAKVSLFDGVDMTWKRVKGGEKIQVRLDKLLKTYDFKNPSASIAALCSIRKDLDALGNEPWVKIKKEAVDELILNMAGFYGKLSSRDKQVVPGDSISFTLELISRGIDASVDKISLSHGSWSKKAIGLEKNKTIEEEFTIQWPVDAECSTPYWLKEKGTLGTYFYDSRERVLQPESMPAGQLKAVLMINDCAIPLTLNMEYSTNDPVKGEIRQPLYVVPPISIEPQTKLQLVKKGESVDLHFKVRAFSDYSGELKMRQVGNWDLAGVPLTDALGEPINSEAWTPRVDLIKGEEKEIVVRLKGGAKSVSGQMMLYSVRNGVEYDQAVRFIEYDHIPRQVILEPSAVDLNLLDLKITGKRIGYLTGAGDQVPEALELMGYKVDILDDQNLGDLSVYDAILVGIRFMNVNERAGAVSKTLFKYVNEGGNVIVQYNTSHRLKTDEIGPYPLKLGRDRVTNEVSDVKILQESHPIFQTPNNLTQVDFEGWVQERGLYFPSEWSEEYLPMIEWNDPGESPKQGALLVAKYGKGNYVYTGISFFRQLPAGVPGAYRLLANLIAL